MTGAFYLRCMRSLQKWLVAYIIGYKEKHDIEIG